MPAAFYVGNGTIASGSSGTPVAISPTCPATVLAGDLLLLVLCGSTSGGSNNLTSITLPSGWTAFANGGLSVRFSSALMYKLADGTEGGTTVTTGWGFSATTGFATAQIYQIRGNAQVAPEASVTSTGNSTTATLGSFTTAANNDLLVDITTNSLVNTSFTGISGSSISWTNQHTDGDATRAEAINIQTSTALVATSGTVVSGGSTTMTSGNWVSYVFAVKPFIPPAQLEVMQAVNRAARF